MSIADISTIVALVLAIGTLIWRLSAKFNNIDKKLESMGMLLFVVSEGIVTKRINNELKGRIKNALANFNMAFDNSFVQAYRGTEIERNPITQAELRRLKQYLEKIKRAEDFTSEEAKDFYDIAEKIKNDRPSNSSTLLLAGLAGFVLGLIIGLKD